MGASLLARGAGFGPGWCQQGGECHHGAQPGFLSPVPFPGLPHCPLAPLSPRGRRCRQPHSQVCARFYYPTSTLTGWSSRPLPPPAPKKRSEEEKKNKVGDEAATPVCRSSGLEVADSPGWGGMGMPQGSRSSPSAHDTVPAAQGTEQSQHRAGTSRSSDCQLVLQRALRSTLPPQGKRQPCRPKTSLGCTTGVWGARLAP